MSEPNSNTNPARLCPICYPPDHSHLGGIVSPLDLWPEIEDLYQNGCRCCNAHKETCKLCQQSRDLYQ